MTFVESIQTCFRQYATFEGRATRSEYWWFVLFLILTQLVAELLSPVLAGIFVLATLLPAIAAATRRLHDIDKSGWWQLLGFVPIVGGLIIGVGEKLFEYFVGPMIGGATETWFAYVLALGFLVSFVFGGLTGVIMASPPLDFHISDSYFIVAHFHYVVFGTVVFAMFAGFYFWWPKWTGKMLNERLGYVHFWMLFIGFHMTFLIQHWLGVDGMVRRYADYAAADGWTWQNQVSTVGAMLLGASMIPFFLNVWLTARKAPRVTVNDPWGYGGSLEWATSCPPPRHNFTSIPRIRSERPAFDLNHPEAAVPVGVGPAKDAPDAPVVDVADGEVK